MQRHFYATIAAAVLSLATTAHLRAQDAGKLNDLEIAHVAYNAGLVDIRYAHLALAISKNPEVRKFAETMLRDHSAVNEQALALVKKLNAQPKDNAVSQDVLAKSEALVSELRSLEGAAFDKRYAANELAYHQFVNGAVEKVFVPNAQNQELKALLQSALKVFKVHEHHAEMMVKAVQ